MREHLLPWTQQPQGAARAREGVGAAWSCDQVHDAVSGLPALFGTTNLAAQVLSSSGVALRVASTFAVERAVLRVAPGTDAPGAGDFTVITRFVLRGTGGYAALARWNTGGSPSTCDWLLGAGATFGGSGVDFIVACGGATYAATIATGWTTGTEYILIGRRRGTTVLVDRWAGSTLLSASTTNAGITTVNSNSARALKVGEIDAGAQFNADIDLIGAALLPRAISDEEVRALAGEGLWDFAFEPQSIPVPVAAGSVVPGATSSAEFVLSATTAAAVLVAAASAGSLNVTPASTGAAGIAAASASSIEVAAASSTTAAGQAQSTALLELQAVSAAQAAVGASSNSVVGVAAQSVAAAGVQAVSAAALSVIAASTASAGDGAAQSACTIDVAAQSQAAAAAAAASACTLEVAVAATGSGAIQASSTAQLAVAATSTASSTGANAAASAALLDVAAVSTAQAAAGAASAATVAIAAAANGAAAIAGTSSATLDVAAATTCAAQLLAQSVGQIVVTGVSVGQAQATATSAVAFGVLAQSGTAQQSTPAPPALPFRRGREIVLAARVLEIRV